MAFHAGSIPATTPTKSKTMENERKKYPPRRPDSKKCGAKYKGLDKKSQIVIHEATIREIETHKYDVLKDVASKAVRQYINANS